MDNKVSIQLDVDNGQFTVKMNDAILTTGKFGEAGEKASKGWGQSAIEINQALELVGKAVELVKLGFEKMAEAVEVAGGHEQAVYKLNQTLAVSGQYSESASKHFQELADNISKTSNVSEKLVLQTAQVAARYTTTSAETEKLTQAALRLSAATGIDAQTAVLRLGLSLDGINARLNRTIPGVGQLTEEQLKHGAAVDFVMNKYPNLDNTILTFNGRMDLLKNSFEKVMVQIGDMIVKSPILNKAIEDLAKWFQEAAEKLQKFVESGEFEQMIKDTVAFGQDLVTYVIAPLELLYNVGKYVFDGIVFLIQSTIAAVADLANAIVHDVIGGIQFIMQGFINLMSWVDSDLANKMQTSMDNLAVKIKAPFEAVAEVTASVEKDKLKKLDDSFANLFNFSFSNTLSKRLGEIDHFVKTAKVKQLELHNASKPPKAEEYDEEKLLKAQLDAKLQMIESNNYAIENAAKVHESTQIQMEDKIYNYQVKKLKEKIKTHQATYKDIERIEQQHQMRLNQVRDSYNNVSVKNFNLGWQGAMANMKKQFTNFATLTQTLATKTHSIVSNGFIQMAKDHKFSMDQILNQFLSMIGETMIQWGTFDLLSSIWPPNPAGLAAGAALIAAGAVLVGVGSSATASPASSTPGGAGSDTMGGGIASPGQAMGSQLQQKSAQIIIQGDYLNSTQTQQHLTDIIRQSSDVTDFAIVAQGKSF